MTAPPDVAARPARRNWLSRLRPRKAAGQIALLVVAAILAADVLATVALFALQEPWRADARPGVAAGRLATVARLLDETAPEARAAVLASAARSLPNLQFGLWDGAAPAANGGGLDQHPLVERLRSGFGRELVIVDLTRAPDAPSEPDILHLGLRTPNGATLRATLPDNPLNSPRQGVVVFTFLVLALSLTLLSVWATRALTAPLAQLSEAAEAFGTRREPVPLPQRGPEEVLAVARALDRMRERVNRLLDERTQMLAAISHDLRTPITRLRLRAEFIEDPQMRERTLRDLDQMNALVASTLSYVRDERSGEGEGAPRPLIDLGTLLQTIRDDFADTGADVRLEPPPRLLTRGHSEDLGRAIVNLVDNAVKYAGGAKLALRSTPGGVAIEVGDDGPGIPEAERAAMLQPFVRGDRARTRDDAGGFGLGLSIVRAIAKAHRGRLSLEDRPGGGLLARIELPWAEGRDVIAEVPREAGPGLRAAE